MTTFSITNPMTYITAQPHHYSSRIIRREVTEFANQTKDLANQIRMQHTPNKYEGRVVIRNHYYMPLYTPWYYPRPTVVVLGNPYRPVRNRDNGDGIVLGILATIGALFATYAVGTALAEHNDAKRELDETRKTKENFLNYRRLGDENDEELLQEAIHAASLKERICSRIQRSALLSLILRVKLAVGLSLVAAGAFIACPPLAGIGLISSLVSTAAMLFKWGFDSTDKANLRDAKDLQESLMGLSQL